MPVLVHWTTPPIAAAESAAILAPSSYPRLSDKSGKHRKALTQEGSSCTWCMMVNPGCSSSLGASGHTLTCQFLRSCTLFERIVHKIYFLVPLLLIVEASVRSLSGVSAAAVAELCTWMHWLFACFPFFYVASHLSQPFFSAGYIEGVQNLVLFMLWNKSYFDCHSLCMACCRTEGLSVQEFHTLAVFQFIFVWKKI